jgi:acyl carrier protein
MRRDRMETLLKILCEACPGVDFKNEKALVDDEILDSMDIVTIVSEIISEFQIELNVEDLIPENFNSVEAIMKLIEQRLS